MFTSRTPRIPSYIRDNTPIEVAPGSYERKDTILTNTNSGFSLHSKTPRKSYFDEIKDGYLAGTKGIKHNKKYYLKRQMQKMAIIRIAARRSLVLQKEQLQRLIKTLDEELKYENSRQIKNIEKISEVKKRKDSAEEALENIQQKIAEIETNDNLINAKDLGTFTKNIMEGGSIKDHKVFINTQDVTSKKIKQISDDESSDELTTLDFRNGISKLNTAVYAREKIKKRRMDPMFASKVERFNDPIQKEKAQEPGPGQYITVELSNKKDNESKLRKPGQIVLDPNTMTLAEINSAQSQLIAPLRKYKDVSEKQKEYIKNVCTDPRASWIRETVHGPDTIIRDKGFKSQEELYGNYIEVTVPVIVAKKNNNEIRSDIDNESEIESINPLKKENYNGIKMSINRSKKLMQRKKYVFAHENNGQSWVIKNPKEIEKRAFKSVSIVKGGCVSSLATNFQNNLMKINHNENKTTQQAIKNVKSSKSLSVETVDSIQNIDKTMNIDFAPESIKNTLMALNENDSSTYNLFSNSTKQLTEAEDNNMIEKKLIKEENQDNKKLENSPQNLSEAPAINNALLAVISLKADEETKSINTLQTAKPIINKLQTESEMITKIKLKSTVSHPYRGTAWTKFSERPENIFMDLADDREKISLPGPTSYQQADNLPGSLEQIMKNKSNYVNGLIRESASFKSKIDRFKLEVDDDIVNAGTIIQTNLEKLNGIDSVVEKIKKQKAKKELYSLQNNAFVGTGGGNTILLSKNLTMSNNATNINNHIMNKVEKRMDTMISSFSSSNGTTTPKNKTDAKQFIGLSDIDEIQLPNGNDFVYNLEKLGNNKNIKQSALTTNIANIDKSKLHPVEFKQAVKASLPSFVPESMKQNAIENTPGPGAYNLRTDGDTTMILKSIVSHKMAGGLQTSYEYASNKNRIHTTKISNGSAGTQYRGANLNKLVNSINITDQQAYITSLSDQQLLEQKAEKLLNDIVNDEVKTKKINDKKQDENPFGILYSQDVNAQKISKIKIQEPTKTARLAEMHPSGTIYPIGTGKNTLSFEKESKRTLSYIEKKPEDIWNTQYELPGAFPLADAIKKIENNQIDVSKLSQKGLKEHELNSGLIVGLKKSAKKNPTMHFMGRKLEIKFSEEDSNIDDKDITPQVIKKEKVTVPNNINKAGRSLVSSAYAQTRAQSTKQNNVQPNQKQSDNKIYGIPNLFAQTASFVKNSSNEKEAIDQRFCGYNGIYAKTKDIKKDMVTVEKFRDNALKSEFGVRQVGGENTIGSFRALNNINKKIMESQQFEINKFFDNGDEIDVSKEDSTVQKILYTEFGDRLNEIDKNNLSLTLPKSISRQRNKSRNNYNSRSINANTPTGYFENNPNQSSIEYKIEQCIHDDIDKDYIIDYDKIIKKKYQLMVEERKKGLPDFVKNSIGDSLYVPPTGSYNIASLNNTARVLPKYVGTQKSSLGRSAENAALIREQRKMEITPGPGTFELSQDLSQKRSFNVTSDDVVKHRIRVIKAAIAASEDKPVTNGLILNI